MPLFARRPRQTADGQHFPAGKRPPMRTRRMETSEHIGKIVLSILALRRDTQAENPLIFLRFHVIYRENGRGPLASRGQNVGRGVLTLRLIQVPGAVSPLGLMMVCPLRRQRRANRRPSASASDAPAIDPPPPCSIISAATPTASRSLPRPAPDGIVRRIEVRRPAKAARTGWYSRLANKHR